MRLVSIAFAFLVSVLGCPPCSAVVIHVEADGSGDAPTIAAAYELAVAGDIIQLGDGTFHEFDLVMKSGVHLVSRSGNAELTNIVSLGHRCLVATTIDAATEVVGITLGWGTAELGGLVLVDDSGEQGGRLTFRDCSFVRGLSGSGGAVAVLRGSVRFERCRFEYNEAASWGGAIFMEYPAEVIDCEFVWNNASFGGAIGLITDPLTEGFILTQGCVFRENWANGSGGAINCHVLPIKDPTERPLRIEGCRFIENLGFSKGGAVDLSGPVTIGASGFFDNWASIEGGALILDGLSLPLDSSFDGNLFVRNRADFMGGAVLVESYGHGIMNFERCTFVSNGAKLGGHLAGKGSQPSIRLSECILALTSEGAAADGFGSPCDAMCCDIYGNAGGDYVGYLAGLDSVQGNFSSDPQFCDASSDDFSLAETSPCLDPPAPCLGPIGAYGVGCGPVSVEATSWGRIKAAYR